MIDLDRELRDLLHDKAEEAHAPKAAPAPMLNRVRRRQAAAALVASTMAVVVIAGAVAGLGILLPLARDGRPLGGDVGATRRPTVAYVTITYPKDWVLTVRSEPADIAATVQLASFDPDVRANPVCFSENQSMPPNGVLLHIEVGSGPIGPDAPRWPQEFTPSDFGDPRLCGVAGEQLSASWASEDGSLPFVANALIGPSASTDDRERLLNAYRSLSFPILGDEVQLAGVNEGAAAVVLASGEIDGRPWATSASPDADQPGIRLEMGLGGEGGGLRGNGIGGVLAQRLEDTWVSSPIMGGNTMMHGAVSRDIARVEVRPMGADPFDAELLDPPPSLGATFRAFVAPMSGAPRGTVVTFDPSGNLVREIAFTPDGYSSPRTESERTAPPEGAVASGKALGTKWRLVDTGDELWLVDDEGRMLGSVSRSPDPHLSLAVHTFTEGDKAASIVFGAGSAETTQVVLFTSGLPGSTQQTPLGDGTIAYWQAWVPGDVEGQVIAVDPNCEVLQAIDVATSRAPASPAPTSCD